MPASPQVEACLDELGLCFCFAPLMHPSMKHVAAVRKKLGIRTIFNILGPLVNPAGACYQLLGAGRPELRPLLAGAVARLGTRANARRLGRRRTGRRYARGSNACDRSRAQVSRRTREFTWRPEDFGIARASLDSVKVDGPAASAAIIRRILAGEPGPARDIVVLNAAAGLIVANKSSSTQAAAALAAGAIDSGAAADLLARLVCALSRTSLAREKLRNDCSQQRMTFLGFTSLPSLAATLRPRRAAMDSRTSVSRSYLSNCRWFAFPLIHCPRRHPLLISRLA